MFLQQSAALTIIIGPFLDDTDGKTAETGLTVTSIDVDLYKGATKSDLTITASGGNNDMAHVANGYYSLELTTGNTDTAGQLMVTANISGALPVWRTFTVLPAQVFNSLVAGSDALQVHTSEITSNLITASVLAADAAAEIADAVWDEATSGHTTAGSTGKAITDANNGTPPTAAAVADAVWDEAQSGHTTAGTFGRYLDGEVSDAIAPTAATVADAVWDEALSGHLVIGSTGYALNNAGGAGTDPWNTALPGAYASGTAGHIIGNRLDAAVSTLASGDPGAGAIEFIYTITDADTSDPIPDVDVWATSDTTGNTLLASGRTNSSGAVVFWLDAGTVYIWRQKPGYNFTNPDTETVS